MRKYRLVAKKGEGTFSEVLKAQNVKDGKYHAIKCMKNRFESIDQVNNLREIQALRRLSPHEHIITLEEVLYDQPTGRLALVFELMDANLYELIRGRKHYLNPQLVKSYMWQLMKALDHMHKKGIFHRDIKPENILIESTSDVSRGLKLADLGSCRGIYSKQPYTEYISTRWYRAPECLLTDGYYGPEMDLWGAGCVMFEITSLFPLFPGTNEVDQISRIHKVLGSPSEAILTKFRSKGASHISFDFPQQKGCGILQLIQHASADTIDLIDKQLKYDSAERITAREAMRHPYFREVRESDSKRSGGQAAEAGTTAAGTTEGGNGSHYNLHKQSSNRHVDEQKVVPQGKALPSISASEQGQKQGQASLFNPNDEKGQSYGKTQNSNAVPVAHTALQSLPPISNSIGNNGKQGSVGGSGASAMSNAGGGYGSSNLTNTQKRRKKYKNTVGGGSMQQGMRRQQMQVLGNTGGGGGQGNVGNLMKAYGVPKDYSLASESKYSSGETKTNAGYAGGYGGRGYGGGKKM